MRLHNRKEDDYKLIKLVIKFLKEKSLISSNCENILHESLSGATLALMERVISRKKSDKRYRYAEELRSFPITLQFSSSTAYYFVRKTLNLALPHPAQIRKWYSKVPAEPGFMEPAFDELQAYVISAREKGHEVLCSRIIDEMAICRHAEWDGQKYCGFVDLGTGIDDNDSFPLAKDAFVFMVVAVNST